MKPMSSARAVLAITYAAVLLPVLCLSCSKPEVSAPASAPAPSISVLVNSIPANVEVAFAGERLGATPVSLKVDSFDKLIDSFSTLNTNASTVEQRISVISEEEVEVNLVLDPNFSKMAKALNLSKIIVFDYGERITFDVNSADLKPNFTPLLEKQAEMLKKNFSGVDAYICGHTDSDGRPDYNLSLSLRRAESVYNRLLGMGVPNSVMKVQGFGSKYPLSDNKTKEGKARNRRIEIILGR